MDRYLAVLGIVAIVVTSRVAYRMDMNWFVFLTGLAVVGFWATVWWPK